MAPTSHSFGTPSGLRLAVHDWGGAGDPVLLTHPTGFHGHVWAPVAERLVVKGRHVWSFDFRGHGDSDQSPDGTYSWAEFASDALAVMTHLELAGDPRLLAAGHSKGAAALLLGEADAPGSYARIWAYEPIVFPSDEPLPPHHDNPLSTGARKRRAVWQSREEAIASYASRPPLDVFTEASLHAYVEHGFRELPDGTVALKCEPEHEATVYAMGAANGVYPRLAEVGCPVLVACGEQTDAIVPKLAGMIAERLPRSRLEIWDRCGHFGPQQDPDRAAASILAFAAH
ncbi:MAG: alpha/beta hydrolase [Actinobacteria bacterium]|nr:alpha/beta hydrolase [Actinomycetota bacterium]